jgi:hypothetical protein
MKKTKVKIRKWSRSHRKTQKMLMLFTIKRVSPLAKDYKMQTNHFKNLKMSTLTKKITFYKLQQLPRNKIKNLSNST